MEIMNLYGDTYGQVITMIDVPVQATTLKEFFDVKLHIINNSSSEFSLVDNVIDLKVPDGLTLMCEDENLGRQIKDYLTESLVEIAEIKGQECKTISWLLRGDEAGSYSLEADYEGRLSIFDEKVSTKFETSEPIRVFGKEAMKINVYVNETIEENTLYYDIELKNNSPIDIYMPRLNIGEKVRNVYEIMKWQDPTEHVVFESDTNILNVKVINSDGTSSYVKNSLDGSGNVITGIDSLAPGQSLYYECAAYGITSFDELIFMDAINRSFGGYEDIISIQVIKKDLYSYGNITEIVERMVSNQSVKEDLNYIMKDRNFYYPYLEEGIANSIYYTFSTVTKIILEGDLSSIDLSNKKDLARQAIIELLFSEDMLDAIEEVTDSELLEFLKTGINNISINSGDEIINLGEIFSEDDFEFFLNKCKKCSLEELADEILDRAIEKGIEMESESITSLDIVKKLLSNGIDDDTSGANKILKNAKTALRLLADIDNDAKESIAIRDVFKANSNHKVYKLCLEKLKESQANHLDPIYLAASELYDDVAASETEVAEIFAYVSAAVNNFLEYEINSSIKQLIKTLTGDIPYRNTIVMVTKLLDIMVNYSAVKEFREYMELYVSLGESFASASASLYNDRVNIGQPDSVIDESLYLMVRSLCVVREKGERNLKKLFDLELNGKLCGARTPEEDLLKRINKAGNTDYEYYRYWCADIVSNIARRRDNIFNIRNSSLANQPGAPDVTLDYFNSSTFEVFDDSYEYSFGNGEWVSCTNDKIYYVAKEVPATLNVRKKAADGTQSGRITTVAIPSISGFDYANINITYENGRYTISGLDDNQMYYAELIDSQNDFDEKNFEILTSSSGAAYMCSGYSKLLAIKKAANNKNNTMESETVFISVSRKSKLTLNVYGTGTVISNSSDNLYYEGDKVELMADTSEGETFDGWYIDNGLVSSNPNYTTVFTEGMMIDAKFSGKSITGIAVSKKPAKTVYYEDEDLNLSGIEVTAEYDDGTSSSISSGYIAQVDSLSAGTQTVTVDYYGNSDTYEITIEHRPSEWLTVEKETMFSPGKKVKICPICNHIFETEIIPALTNVIDGVSVDNDSKTIRIIPGLISSSDELIKAFEDKDQKVSVIKINSQDGEMPGTGGITLCEGDEYRIVLDGDVDGDGYINDFDINKMILHLNNEEMLTELFKEAGILSEGEDDISIFDVYEVMNISKNSENALQ